MSSNQKNTNPIQFEPAGEFLSENAQVPAEDFGALLEPFTGGAAAAQVTALEHMIQALCVDQSYKDFSQEVLLAFLNATPCEAGSILERDRERGDFFFRAAAGQASDRISAFRVPLGQGVVGHVAESKLPALVDADHPNENHLAWIGQNLNFEVRSVIAFPLFVRGEVFAVIELLNRVGERGFTPQDQELLTRLAQSAGKLIEARLMVGYVARRARSEAA